MLALEPPQNEPRAKWGYLDKIVIAFLLLLFFTPMIVESLAPKYHPWNKGASFPQLLIEGVLLLVSMFLIIVIIIILYDWIAPKYSDRYKQIKIERQQANIERQKARQQANIERQKARQQANIERQRAREQARIERQQEQILLKKAAEEKHQELLAVIQQQFLVQPCPSCHEFKMRLLNISPNSRSIQYECVHCRKKMRAAAATPQATQLSAILADTKRAYKVSQQIVPLQIKLALGCLEFETVPAPMPYEQTTRTPISEAVRTEVWRRDQGRCVNCGSKENLQFDHIIPVSQGGATSARNLQLLCQSCNLAKSAKI